MPLPFAAQLSIELTNIVPVKQAISSVALSVYNTARQLRKSGSDLLVEEDLAAIFSRGKIESSLQMHFKDAVKIGSVVSLHAGSDMMLNSQPGPTTQRALRDEYYMSTIIQLSFLSWFHERTSLANALVECMNQRFAMKLPQSNPDAAYEGIHGTLMAVCAETSTFPWALYVGLVEAKLPKSLSQINKPDLMSGASRWRTLRSSLLLASMDYLYILQSLPEDRIMQVESCNGMIPLVIWAHFILGLTVTIQGSPDGSVKFGQARVSNVIISWSQPNDDGDPNCVSLLDKSMEIILRPDLEDSLAKITAQERIPLEGYGTTFLRRQFNSSTLISDKSQGYSDFVSFICALAIRMSLALFRTPHRVSMATSVLFESHFPDSVERWRILDATRILFRGIDIDESVINRWIEKNIDGDRETWLDRMPTAMSKLLDNQKKSIKYAVSRLILPCSLLVLSFSHVSELEACAALPLVYGFHSTMFQDPLYRSFNEWDWKSVLSIVEDDWFNQICKLLMGFRFRDHPEITHERTYLLSDFGWSVFFSNVGDYDPAEIDLGMLCIKKGVPFNPKTGERKYRILDALPIIDDQPPNSVVDDRGNFIPRCVYKIAEPTEYFSSRSQEFWRTCRYNVSDSPGGTNFFLHCGYRHLHRALWGTMQTDPCEHCEEDLGDQKLGNVKLGLDAVTVKGFNWTYRDVDRYGNIDIEDLDDRICILLVQGNRHARWLALGGLIGQKVLDAPGRQVLLRTDYCCVDCAIKAASQFPHKWLIIL